VDKTATHHNRLKYSYIVSAKNEIGESKKSYGAQIDDQLSAETAAFLAVFLTMLIFAIIYFIDRNNNKYPRTV
jgi:hypothetical protein